MEKTKLLFTPDSGFSITFGLVDLLDDASVHDHVANVVLVNGGGVTHAARNADSLHTPIVFLDLRRSATELGATSLKSCDAVHRPDTYHFSYVKDCVRKGRVLDPTPYRVQAESSYSSEVLLVDAIFRGCKWSQLMRARSPVIESPSVDSGSVQDPRPAAQTQAETEAQTSSATHSNSGNEMVDIDDYISALCLKRLHPKTDVKIPRVVLTRCCANKTYSADDRKSPGPEDSEFPATITEFSVDDSGCRSAATGVTSTTSSGKASLRRSEHKSNPRLLKRRSGLPRHKFSDRDDVDILMFIAEYAADSPYSVTGRTFWHYFFYSMPPSLRAHSPLSLWTRFLRFVLPNLASYRVTVNLSVLQKVAAESRRK